MVLCPKNISNLLKMKGGKGAKAPCVMKKELEKILENEKFVKELMLKETREEAKKAIEGKKVSVTDEEMEEIYQLYSSIYKECKKMSKEDLDKIAGGGPGVIKTVKNWLYGDEVSNKTGGLLNNEIVTKFAVGGAAVLTKIARDKYKANIDKQAHEREMESRRVELQEQKIALDNKKTNLAIGTVGVVGAATLLYTFRDDIKSWIKGK